MILHTQIHLCYSGPLVDFKPSNNHKISFETRYDLAALLIMTHNLKQAQVMQMKSTGKSLHQKTTHKPKKNPPKTGP